MGDPAIREIQLNRKQLVFGVISAVGVSVVIFLLGVSVGRGALATSASAAVDHSTGVAEAPVGAPVQAANAQTAGAPVPDTAPPSTASDASSQKPVDPPAPPDETPPPPAVAPKSTAPSSAPISVAQPEASKTPAASPAIHSAGKTEPVKSMVAPAATVKHGDWVVQVASFKSKENADRMVVTLKSASYPAFMLSPSASGGFYRVQIGPFADHADADKTANHLIKEGYKPSVTR